MLARLLIDGVGRCRKANPLHYGSKRKARFTLPRDKPRSGMRHSIILFLAACAGLLGMDEALAQPGRGAMGPQSRADVRISVSVVPRFEARTASPAKDAGGALLVESNARGLRYSLVTEEQEKAAAHPAAGRRRLLVLVVPD